MTWGEQPVAAIRAVCSTTAGACLLIPAGAQSTDPVLNQETSAVPNWTLLDLLCFLEDTFCLSSTQQPSRSAQEDLLRSRYQARRGLSIPSVALHCSFLRPLLANYVVVADSHFILVVPARFHSFQRLLPSHALARSFLSGGTPISNIMSLSQSIKNLIRHGS